MAGKGFAPKPSSRRAGHTKDPIPSTTLEFVQGVQPELPTEQPSGDPWPVQTRSWWGMWGESPLSLTFTANDWSELFDTALYHAALWSGSLAAGTELRLRVAKFGATPEDRARLRIQFAQADDADAKRPAAPVSRDRYSDLRSVG